MERAYERVSTVLSRLYTQTLLTASGKGQILLSGIAIRLAPFCNSMMRDIFTRTGLISSLVS
jgi:hypothetical protein